MKTNDEILEAMEKTLAGAFEDLWDELTPEERGIVRKGDLLLEFLSAHF